MLGAGHYKLGMGDRGVAEEGWGEVEGCRGCADVVA